MRHAQDVRDRLVKEARASGPKRLEPFGWKVTSQNDEDGIVHEIFRRIGTTNRLFVEFGVELICNTMFLLHQGWGGGWIEGSDETAKVLHTRLAPLFASGKLRFRHAFVTRDNINGLIGGFGFPREIDLLSVDIDGNDYHIWEAIDVVSPRVVVIEYNPAFPPPIHFVMDYNSKHVWDRSVNYGASLHALEELGRRKGYTLVGCNIIGVNSFFVRSDLVEARFHIPATAAEHYHPYRGYLYQAMPQAAFALPIRV